MERITRRGEIVRESSLLFKEQNYGQRKWQLETPTNGLTNLLPFFAFAAQHEDDLAKLPTHKDIILFVTKIMQSMRLSNEVALLAVIFVERLIKLAHVQLLTINWRTIVYSSILLAAKYWEDL